MPEPVGFSFLFPVAPIMSLVSAVLLAMLIPGFWKTRVVSLIAIVGWLMMGNLLLLVGTVQWRGNVKDCPVWVDILNALRYIQSIGSFLSMVCFSKFVWQRLQPSARGFYDTRRRQNRIDVFLTLLLPVMWIPTGLFVWDCRYQIVEDFGVVPGDPPSLPGLLFMNLSLALCAATIAIFNLMTLVTYCRFRKDTTISAFANRSASVRTRKLVLFSLMNMFLAVFAIYSMGWPYLDRLNSIEEFPLLAQIPGRLKVIKFHSRADVDADALFLRIYTTHCISKIALGFYMFAWFGFSEEATRPCREAFAQLSRLVSITIHFRASAFPEQRSRRWTRWFQKSKLHQESTGPVVIPSPFGRANSPVSDGIEPFFHLESPDSLTTSCKDKPHVWGGGKPRSNKPPRRLSFHKPPLPLGTASDPGSSGETSKNTASHRISCHKPALPPNYLDAPILPALLPGGLEPCRLSHHKPLLPPEYTPSLEASSSAPMVPRRLSYHKPSPPMIPGDASTPGLNASRCPPSQNPSLLASHTNFATFGANATDAKQFDLLPIQLFLPPVPQTQPPGDLQMISFTGNTNER